jgi:hypothetical protein
MVFQSRIVRKVLFLLIGGIVSAQPAYAEWSALIARYPSGSIQSEERADQALKDIEVERQALDARFVESERACYARFFVNDCLRKAKDQRRDAMTRMRSIEIEANTFKRRVRAEVHEKAAAERTVKREAQANERVQTTNSPPGSPPTSDDSGTK